jgi:hypothetical protein
VDAGDSNPFASARAVDVAANGVAQPNVDPVDEPACRRAA